MCLQRHFVATTQLVFALLRLISSASVKSGINSKKADCGVERRKTLVVATSLFLKFAFGESQPRSLIGLLACLLACLRVIAAGDCHAAKAARNLRVNSAYQSVVQTIMQAYHMMIIAIYATYFNTFRPQPQPPGIPGGRDEIKAPLPKLNARSIPHPSSRIPFVAPSA